MTAERNNRKIQRINVFTDGDSTDPSVWSNVPYLLCRALESKGITVNRINYQSLSTPLLRFMTLLCDFLYAHIAPRRGKGYLFAKIYYALVERKIRQGSLKHPADLNITPYNCGNRYSPQPTLLLGDWTQEYLYRVRLEREPQGYQKFYAERQHLIIEQSDYVVSLFSACADDMRTHYRNPQIFHLGRNAVNNLYDQPLDPDAVICTKEASHRFLFVGKIHYIDAARQLVRIFSRIRLLDPNAELDIIGLETGDFDTPLPPSVHCYGYLNKGIPAQRATYYELLLGARVFVNTTQLWGGYSSTIEAMYFYTPVIVSPYKEFTAEFGTEIPFGGYSTDSEDNRLCALLAELLDNSRYRSRCLEAHKAVADYTWEQYAEALLLLVENDPPQTIWK